MMQILGSTRRLIRPSRALEASVAKSRIFHTLPTMALGGARRMASGQAGSGLGFFG